VEIDIYTEFNNDLENIWTNFEKNAVMTPFQSYGWLSYWQHTVGGPLLSVQPRIIHLHKKGNTIAILPMGIRRILGLRILEWLGFKQADYMGPLLISNFDKKNYNENTWELIRSNISGVDVIHLRKQFKQTVSFIEGVNFFGSSYQKLKANKILLLDNWDEYFGNIRKKLRSDSQRQRRRLEEIGKVNFNISERAEGNTKIIQSMITQKSRRYRETGLMDMLAVKEYQQFYQGLGVVSFDNMKVHCAALCVGDVMVATHVGIVDKDTFYYLMPANKGGNWKKYSPGRLLLIELINWAMQNKLKFFDFTVGDETYKKDWCNIETDLFDIRKVVTPIGLFYIFALYINLFVKKVSFLQNIVKKYINNFKMNK
jgi:CelD/BcsL family acetyltransferase involved in cellulose biosynthesis